ncbi:MAG: hypothetical protein Q7R89_03800 [bacterium]|nr:hypothetical protein [bacterium]
MENIEEGIISAKFHFILKKLGGKQNRQALIKLKWAKVYGRYLIKTPNPISISSIGNALSVIGESNSSTR